MLNLKQKTMKKLLFIAMMCLMSAVTFGKTSSEKAKLTKFSSLSKKEINSVKKNKHTIWVTTSCGVEFPLDTVPGETLGSVLYSVMILEEFFCG